MDSFIFNNFKKRLITGELKNHVDDTWKFSLVNTNFSDTYEEILPYIDTLDTLKNIDKKKFPDTKFDRFYVNYLPVYYTYKVATETITGDQPIYVDNDNWDEFEKLYPNNTHLKDQYLVKNGEYARQYESGVDEDGNVIKAYRGFYFVMTAEELKWCANKVNGDINGVRGSTYNNEINIILGDNIGIFNANSTEENKVINFSIGASSLRPFEGIFDGNGYIIQNITFIGNNNNSGIIGNLGKNGIIRNIRIKGKNIVRCNKKLDINHLKEDSSDINMAILCGKNNGKIDRVRVEGTISFEKFYPGVYTVNNKTGVGDAYAAPEQNDFLPSYLCINSMSNIVPYVGYFAEGVFSTVGYSGCDYNLGYWKYDTDGYDTSHVHEYIFPKLAVNTTISGDDDGEIYYIDEYVSGTNYMTKLCYDNNIIDKTNSLIENDTNDSVNPLFNRNLVTYSKETISNVSTDEEKVTTTATSAIYSYFNTTQYDNMSIKMHQFNRASFNTGLVIGCNKGNVNDVTVSATCELNDTYVGFMGGLAGKECATNISADIKNVNISFDLKDNISARAVYESIDKTSEGIDRGDTNPSIVTIDPLCYMRQVTLADFIEETEDSYNFKRVQAMSVAENIYKSFKFNKPKEKFPTIKYNNLSADKLEYIGKISLLNDNNYNPNLKNILVYNDLNSDLLDKNNKNVKTPIKIKKIELVGEEHGLIISVNRLLPNDHKGELKKDVYTTKYDGKYDEYFNYLELPPENEEVSCIFNDYCIEEKECLYSNSKIKIGEEEYYIWNCKVGNINYTTDNKSKEFSDIIDSNENKNNCMFDTSYKILDFKNVEFVVLKPVYYKESIESIESIEFYKFTVDNLSVEVKKSDKTPGIITKLIDYQTFGTTNNIGFELKSIKNVGGIFGTLVLGDGYLNVENVRSNILNDSKYEFLKSNNVECLDGKCLDYVNTEYFIDEYKKEKYEDNVGYFYVSGGDKVTYNDNFVITSGTTVGCYKGELMPTRLLTEDTEDSIEKCEPLHDYVFDNRFGGFAAICEFNSSNISDRYINKDDNTLIPYVNFVGDNIFRYDEPIPSISGNKMTISTMSITTYDYSFLYNDGQLSLYPNYSYGVALPFIAEIKPTFLTIPSIIENPLYAVNDFYINPEEDEYSRIGLFTIDQNIATPKNAGWFWSINFNVDIPGLKGQFNRIVNGEDQKGSLEFNNLSPLFDRYFLDHLFSGFNNVRLALNNAGYFSAESAHHPDYSEIGYGVAGNLYSTVSRMASINAGDVKIDYSAISAGFSDDKQPATYPYFGSDIILVNNNYDEKYYLPIISADEGIATNNTNIVAKGKFNNNLFEVRSENTGKFYIPENSAAHFKPNPVEEKLSAFNIESWPSVYHHNFSAADKSTELEGTDIFKYEYEVTTGTKELNYFEQEVSLTAVEVSGNAIKLGYWFAAGDNDWNIPDVGKIKKYNDDFYYNENVLHLGTTFSEECILNKIRLDSKCISSALSANDFEGLLVTDKSDNLIMYINTHMGNCEGIKSWSMVCEPSIDIVTSAEEKRMGLLLEIK